MQRYRWVIFAVMSSIYFFVYFHRTSTAVLADELMNEFAVSALAVGVMSSAYFYPYGVLQIPVGYLSDTKGPRFTTTVFTFITFAGSILFALSSSFGMAVAGRFLIGVGVSGVYIPTIKILSQWFREREFATLTGVLFAVGNFGALVSAYPLALMAIIFGWREAFLIIGFITLFLALLCWITVRDSPQSTETAKISDSNSAPFTKNIRTIVTNRTLWLIAFSAFLRYGITMGYQGLWGGPYLMDVYNLQRDFAGSVLMMVGIGTIAGAPLIGYLSDRVFRTRKWFLVFGSAGLAFSLFPLAFVTKGLSLPELYIISFAMGFFGGSGPVAYALIKEAFSLEVTGLATSIVNTFPFFGGAAFQIIMGYLMDAVGISNGVYPAEAYSLAFKFCLLSAIASTILVLFVRENR
ncbi:MFS transporter [Archaeoglobus neptunius]|uniref:MFS transporter n=1 Tax=Archaeoglobus neptunius TaxID=2798580 RepID=UPI001926DCA0